MSLMPLPYRLLAVALLCAAMAGFGWMRGAAHVQARWDAAKAAEAVHAAKVQAAQAAVTVQTVTQYVDRVKVVHDTAATITKEVPIYVTKNDDAACTINAGFVRLWNSANSGMPIPDATGPADDAASGVALSGVEAEHTAESEYTRGLEIQLTALQAWAAGQAAIR